jgi:hypothetical protein
MILISKMRNYILLLKCEFGELVVIMATVVAFTALVLPWYLVSFSVEVVLSLKLLLYGDAIGGWLADSERLACDMILCSRDGRVIVSRAREQPSCLAEVGGGDVAHSYCWMVSGHWDAR